LTGEGAVAVHKAANDPSLAPSIPAAVRAHAITRLLPAPPAPARLTRLTEMDVVQVDRLTCPVVGAGGCALSVSWTASEPWASLRRTRLGGSTGPSPTAFLGNGQHGALVDTLRAGDRVRYDLVGGDGTVLQSSRGV